MSAAAMGSLGLALLAGAAERSAQRARNLVADAEAKAANTIREGQNIENAAKASFSGFMSALNNKRSLDSGGRSADAARANLLRMRDALTRGSIEDQIANAEAAGAYTASVAMSGGGGSSVDNIGAAMRLKQQRQTFYSRERGKQMTHDQLQQIAGVMPQTIAGLDIGTHAAAIDYSTTFSQAKPIMGNFLLDAAGWAAGNPQAAQQAAGSASKFFQSAQSPSPYQLSTGRSSTGLSARNATGFWAQ